MNKFTLACYRSLNIALMSTLILIVTQAVLIEDANAQEVYAEQIEFSEAELAQILAPIALYPDSLLTHILIASTYPLEIVQANRWRTKNRHLDANQALKKAEDKDWDPSVSALLAFPNVLGKLSDDLVWTQKLGAAFLQDEAELLASIQLLRQQADQADSLSEMENMSVTRVNKQIIIEPAQKEIIYVPYYDPRVVYGHWHWYSYPPVYWTPYPYYVPRLDGHFYWSSGVHITFNYYFSTFNWYKHHIVVVNHHNSHHYRHRDRIVTSHGARRWIHKPQHRHGVRYRSNQVKQRYNSHRPSIAHSKQVRNNERHQITNSKANHSKVHSSNKFHNQNKQLTKNREQQFINKLHQPTAKKQHKAVKSQQPIKSHNAVKRHQPAHTKNYQRSRSEAKSQQPIKSHNAVMHHHPAHTKSYLRTDSEVKRQNPVKSEKMKQNSREYREKKHANG